MIDAQMLKAQMEALRIRMMYPGVPNIEDTKTVTVGDTYFVSVAHTRRDSPTAGAYFPVLGDEHDDADFIPIFPDNSPHLHIDWRFIPSEFYSRLVEMALHFFGQNAEALGGHEGYELDVKNPQIKNLQLACVIPANAVTSVERWPLPCFRQQLRWEAHPGWLPNLEAAYKDKKACDGVCPHRGISLTGAPPDKNGARVCPGHGLAWGRDGRLVRREDLKW